ncbi:leucine-rich repeat domain-containing protein [Porphyromonas gulae]|nr:leucine-rich repeat domain-containing protein [Porphyromonas gulae]
MIAEKPRIILDLEKSLNIEIMGFAENEHPDPSKVERFFRINHRKQITSLSIRNCKLTAVDWISRFTSLKELDLSNNEIEDSRPIGKVLGLEKLILYGNQISCIWGLDRLRSLREINLSANHIEDITRFWYLLSRDIEKVNLSGNRIQTLRTDEVFSEHKKLTSLILSGNQIEEITDLNYFPSLTELGLSGNKISDLRGLIDSTRLIHLYLSNNQIIRLKGIENLNNLQRLGLSGNYISDIEEIGHLMNLVDLDLSGNDITEIREIGNLIKIRRLGLSDNRITELEKIDRLRTLEKLYLSSNKITKIDARGWPNTLQVLDLSENEIKQVKGLNRLTALTNLDLSGNQIAQIGAIGWSNTLQVLDLSKNKIANITGIEYFKNLSFLNLSFNQIKTIKSLIPIDSLRNNSEMQLRIGNNPFLEKNNLILKPNQNHLFETLYLLEKKTGNTISYKPFSKVMLLGNHDSGKTTFLSQYDTNYKYQKNTHVLSVHRSNNPNAIFCDFGGQDYYHGIYQAFFTIQSLYLLFWDAKKDRNFVSIDGGSQTLNFNRRYWLGQIAYACNRCMSVGGNPDGKDTPQTTDDTIIIQTHADETGAKQQTLGCAAGNGVLEEIYVSLEPKEESAKHALNYLKERVREVIASRSKSIKITEKDKGLYEALPSIAERNKHSPVSLEALAAELNMGRDENDLYTIEYLQTELNQLSLRGEVLYYRENKKLNNYVWLDPAAFVQMIHGEILQKDDINRGTVPKEVFESKLHRLSSGSTSEEDSQNGNMILQLLLEGLIVYEDKECYVIPGYLPLHSDDEAYKWLTLGFERPNFVLKFEHFIPFGLINQIIAYYGREEGALKKYWRDQVIFTAGREMDRRQLELESKSLPKANAEDYLIWIKLDFTDLAISVFIKEQRKTSAKDMQRKEVAILSDILDMYWDNIPPREQIGDKGAEETRSSIRETNRKKRPIQDLYLSYAQADKDLTESHYIHLGTLDDESKTTAKIAAYPLKDGAIDKERVREVSTRPYKHLSVNKKLSGVKRVFISYSKHDREELEQCLLFFKPLVKSGHIELYYDELTKFETPIHSEIRRRITGADCIIALVSQNYLGTDYILDHELPVIEDYEKTLIPIQIKPCTFYEVETLSKHYFALKAKVVNLDSRIFTVPDGVTASALREQNWCDVVREFKEKILGITKQEVNTDE